jgi:uncharacterized membrane protein YkvA (DUF1232 family)
MTNAPADWDDRALAPAIAAANEDRVRRGFWPKFRRVAGRIPFARDLLAAYYCAMDPATPFRARAILFAALAYFVLPFDAIPDFMAGIGYTDDAAVLMAALSVIGTHIRRRHREMAEAALSGQRDDTPR